MKVLQCSAMFLYILLFCPGMINEQPGRSAADHKKTVPLKGSYSTVSQVLSAPPLLQIRITGTGQSSHLGQGSFVALSTMDLTTPPPFGISGTSIFYGANGDEFFTTFTGTSIPNTDGTMTVEMTHDITGGTGRFTNATGNFTGYTVAGLANPKAHIEYEGTISY
jgi:hypothetical protein